MTHTEVPVKVTAWVDRGVADLVTALNQLPGLLTLDSCEEDENGDAHVFFTARGDSSSLFSAATAISRALRDADDCQSVVAVEWWYGADTPTGRLRCRPVDVPFVAERLLSYARTSPSWSDKTDAGTRSWTAHRDRHD